MAGMKVPPSMQALVMASKLNLEPNTSAKIVCPRCSYDMDVYRTVTGRLMGRCENCELNIPKA